MDKSGAETMIAPPLQFGWPLVGMASAAVGVMNRNIDTQARLQHELLDQGQRVFDRWCERRYLAAQAVVLLTHAALDGGRSRPAAEAWADWYRGATGRLAEDAGDLAETTSAVLRAFTGLALDAEAAAASLPAPATAALATAGPAAAVPV